MLDGVRSKYPGLPDKYKPYIFSLLESKSEDFIHSKTPDYWITLGTALILEKGWAAQTTGLCICYMIGRTNVTEFRDGVKQIEDPLSMFLSGNVQQAYNSLIEYWHRQPDQTDPGNPPNKNLTHEIMRSLTILNWTFVHKIWSTRAEQALQKLKYISTISEDFWILDLVHIVVDLMKIRIGTDNKIQNFLIEPINLSVSKNECISEKWFVIPYIENDRIMWYELAGWLVGWSTETDFVDPEVPYLLDLENSIVIR
jgi:hypothetical protein